MVNESIEFLIRRTDPEGSWFDVHSRDMAKVFTPASVSSEVIAGFGHLRLRLDSAEVSITFEDPGVQIVFQGPIAEQKARKIVEEMTESVCKHTGQHARIIEL